MSLHSDALFKFRASQSLLLLIKAACAYWRNFSFIVFNLTRPWSELTICRTRGEYSNQYAIDAVDKEKQIETKKVSY